MISPIGVQSTVFKSNQKGANKTKDNNYQDPLLKWPLRGAAFSNEVGEALRPMIGNTANLFWVPALLYIGADVYDKYKNNETEYSPDSKRCLKQAVFQGMASIFLPLIAVTAGQDIFSQIGKLGEDKVSINTKEHISKLAEDFIKNGKMRAFDGRDEECTKEFLNIVSDSLDYKQQKKSLKNSIKIFRLDNEKNVDKYATNTITDLIQMRKNLLNPTAEFKAGDWYSSYIKALNAGQTESVAVKSVLKNFQKSKMMKGKFVKTLGGFIALGLAIKPIDTFVEHILIGKYLGPSIDKIKVPTKSNKDKISS